MASTVLAPTALTPALALPSFCLCLFAWNPVTLPLARLTPPGLCLDSTFSGKPSRMPLPPLPGLGTLRPFPPCEGVNLEEARPLQETVLTLPSQGAWPGHGCHVLALGRRSLCRAEGRKRQPLWPVQGLHVTSDPDSLLAQLPQVSAAPGMQAWAHSASGQDWASKVTLRHFSLSLQCSPG